MNTPIKCNIKYYLEPSANANVCSAEVSVWLPTERYGKLHPALCFRLNGWVAGGELQPYWGSDTDTDAVGYRVRRTWFHAPNWKALNAEIDKALEKWRSAIVNSYELYEHTVATQPRDRKLVAWYPDFNWEE